MFSLLLELIKQSQTKTTRTAEVHNIHFSIKKESKERAASQV